MAKKAKKLTKKEKERLADEMEKMMKQQMEQENPELVKEKQQRELKYLNARIQIDTEDQRQRLVQLHQTNRRIQVLAKDWQQYLRREKELNEWNQYMQCDGLPDPASFSEMNTYLFVWTGDENLNNIENVLTKTEEVLNLLKTLDDLIDDPPPNIKPEHVKEWKKIRNDVRVEQQKHIDTATYRLLRHIERDMVPIDLTTAKFVSKCKYFVLNLWAEIVMPIPSSHATDSKQPLTVEFPEVGASIMLPVSLVDIHMAIRALWLRYDHYSDLSPTWDCPPVPQMYSKDLNEVCLNEWELRSQMQSTRDAETSKVKTSLKALVVGANEVAEPARPISDVIASQEESDASDWLEKMRMNIAPHEVNLRKYCVLGGVLHLDLLEQPPQPKDLRRKYVITVLDTPPGLNPIHYYQHYVAPPPPKPGERRTPEEIEVEVKKHEEALEKLVAVNTATETKSKQPADELKREAEKERLLQKLAVITIELPETVLWFEPPMAANWDSKNNYWSTEEIHDLKFNEDKQTVTFRTGRMGLIALIAYRYCNLPYQSWELKPDFKGPPGGVVLSITASVVILEFIIRDDKVCLSQLQNGATSALQEIVGTFYKPRKLMKVIKTETQVDGEQSKNDIIEHFN